MTGQEGEPALDRGEAALRRLREREEVLQICYWYLGEGFGTHFTPNAVMPFLNSDPALVAEAFDFLVAEGQLRLHEAVYHFTDQGKRRAGELFYETFTEFQQASHGECNAGCCDGEDDDVHDHSHHA